MRYEFRYRLMLNTQEYLVEKWNHMRKTLKSENICNSKIEHVPTKDNDIVFQLIGNDKIDIDRLVIVRDTLKTVFFNYMGYECIRCGMCFIT